MGEPALSSEVRWRQRYADFSSNHRGRERLLCRGQVAREKTADARALPVARPADRFLSASSRDLSPTRALRLHPTAAALEAELRDLALEDDRPRSLHGIFRLLAPRERRWGEALECP